MENINDIVEGCKRRDIQSQKELYICYYAVVKSRIRYYVKDVDQINDLTQECFLKIFDKIGHYTGSGSLEGWIKRMAANIAIDYYRRNAKFDDHQDIDSLSETYYENEEEESIISRLGNAVDMEFMQQAVNQLPMKIRMVFVLHIMEDKSHEEISEALNITITNSRKRLQSARKTLKEYLINYHNEKLHPIEWK